MAAFVVVVMIAAASLFGNSIILAQGQNESAIADDNSLLMPVFDFGEVQHGVPIKRTIMFRTSSDKTLAIVDLRVSAGVPIQVSVTKREIEPFGQITLDLVIDTSRFVGHRQFRVQIVTDNGVRRSTQFMVSVSSKK
jgi:hypothetical protein